MTPISVVADSHVAHHRLTFCLNDWNSKGERSRRAVNPATIAERLLREVVADLEPHFISTIVSAEVGDGREIATRKQHD